MKVLIADKIEESVLPALERIGCRVTYRPELVAEDLPGAIAGFQVLVVRSTRVTEATIRAGNDLALVVRSGAGVNTIATEAAANAGIYVANCPGRNADAVAELTIGLLIAADRGIADATADLRAGRWRKSHYQKAAGIKGRRLGIVGYGSIGRAVAKAAQGLGMRVSAWSRSLTPETAAREGIEVAATLSELASSCDAVSVHVAANDETKAIVDERFFDALRDGAIFINTSRGDVVDEAALAAAIERKHLRVGLDVFACEPESGEAAFENTRLAALVTATPHIAASTAQASEAIADETVRVIRRYKETGVPANVVNINMTSPAPWVLVVRHHNRVGVLAAVLEELKSGNVNIEEMQNTIFAGGSAACCTMLVDSLPDDPTIERIRAIDEVLSARVETKQG
jgi:D-3-phosphoglycerate dehydrogenase / 2-oxoglutarate reductase